MDWSVFSPLLQCEMAGGSRLVVLAIGAAAGLSTTILSVYNLVRAFREKKRRRRLADILRDEGEFRASLRHKKQARDLLDASIKLNPNACHVRYLRGCVRDDLGDRRGAISDLKECLKCLPNHRDAKRKLDEIQRGKDKGTQTLFAFAGGPPSELADVPDHLGDDSAGVART